MFDGAKWVVQPSGTTNGIKGMFGEQWKQGVICLPCAHLLATP